MKKITMIMLLLALTLGATAQKLPKIKGNKVVKDVYENLDYFSGIEIDGDYTITLTQGETNSYHIRTDENLLPVINFAVNDSILRITNTHNIRASKKMDIDITYTTLESIELKGNITLKSGNKLNFDTLNFYAYDNVKFDLDVVVQNGLFLLNNSVDGDLNIKGDRFKMVFNENADVYGKVLLNDLEVEINNRADVRLNGSSTNTKITAKGKTDVKLKNLKSESANLIASGKADIYIHASRKLKLYAQGKSYIYVYGNPDIKVEGLNGKSQIIKK